MLQLIFCSVLNGRGQGKTRSHFRRGFLFCSSSGTWMSGDGDSTAGRRGKLTTGNISWGKMPQLIFCLRARKWCLAYSIRESKPFVRRDSSANDVCSIAEIIPFPASMIGETCSHESAVSNGSRREISDRTRRPGAWRIGGWGPRRRTRNGEYQLRGFLATDIPNHCRRMKSFSESSTGRISRAWHIRGTLPEGRTHDGKYQLGHNVPTDIPLRFRLFWARENPVPF